MTVNDTSSDAQANPGSAEAVELGCCCPVKRNNLGKRAPFPAGTHIGGSTGGWMISVDCALHATSVFRGAFIR